MADVNPRLLRRMLLLRQFPMFATAELSELATIAENLVETEFAPGAVVAPAGARLPGLYLVLDGRIHERGEPGGRDPASSASWSWGRARRGGHERGASKAEDPAGSAGRSWGPREIFGELEAFAGRDHAVRAVAATETRTLLLSASDLAEIVEDNFGVLIAVVRDLAARLLARRPRARVIALPRVDPGLGLVERLIALRQLAPFVGARLQGLAMLAHSSEEVSWAPGATVARAGELASGFALVLDGALRAQEPGGATSELAPGQAFGGLETLAGVGHGATLVAAGPVRALYSSAAAIFDVLEDHPDIAMSMIGVFARGLLDSPPPAPPAPRGPAN
jgi:CRP-like cAMP-binding protein